MSATIINLILQLIAGAIGGNAVGAANQNMSLGTGGNTIAGAVGGLAGGSLLTSLIPMLSGAGGIDIAQLAGQLVGGGVSGAIVTAIVGMVMKSIEERLSAGFFFRFARLRRRIRGMHAAERPARAGDGRGDLVWV